MDLDNQTFLETLFGDLWPEVHVCAIPGDPAAKDLPKWYWSGGQARHMLPHCLPDTNNYYTVSLFAGERQEINFRALHVLGVDDVGPKLDPAKVRELTGRQPDYIIETSQGNEQWGYRITPPLVNGDVAKRLIHDFRIALTGETGTDPGMEGVNRYLRLPVGVNAKPSAKAWKMVVKHWAG